MSSLRVLAAVCVLSICAIAQSTAPQKHRSLPEVGRRELVPWHLQDQKRVTPAYERVRLEVPTSLEAPFSLRVPWDGVEHVLDLRLYDVRAADCRLIAVGDGGVRQEYAPGERRTFRGTLRDDKSAVVAGTLLASGMQAVVFLDDGRVLEIQPDFEAFAAGDRTSFIVFDTATAAGCCQGSCGVTDDLRPSPVPQTQQGWNPPCNGDLCLAEIAFDCDFPFFQTWGSSLFLTQDIAEHTLNVANVQYERELHIRHRLTATIVRTSAGSEPAGYATATNTGQLANALRSEWLVNQSGIVRDLTHLLTARFGGDGLAEVGTGCAIGGYYGLSSCALDLVAGTNGLTCFANLVAHELGHNWGAHHCACASPPYTMNDVYAPCPLRFGPTSVAEIDANRDTYSWCLDSSVYNDDCAYAMEVCPGDTYIASNVGATTDGTGSCGTNTGADVWYFYRPASSGTLSVTTCDPATTFDTVLSVHTACPGTTANQIGCNDDSCASPALSSTVSATVTAGETYWIRVAGYNHASGTFALSLAGPACRAPINDARDLAMDIGPGQYYGNTASATRDGTSACDAASASGDVWFRYSPYTSEMVTLATFGSMYDTVLAVYDASGTTELLCNDDALAPYGSLQSFLEFLPSSGATYLIRVSGALGASGPFKLDLSGPDSMNSMCWGAREVLAGTRIGSFEGVFANVGASSCLGDEQPNLFYFYQATSTGTLIVSTCGTHDLEGVDAGVDTVLSLHTGCPASVATQLACNDDAFGPCGSDDVGNSRDAYVSTAVSAGEIVLIRVSRASAFQGRKAFELHVVLRPPNDSCANATALGGGTFAGTLVGATNDGTATCGSLPLNPDVWYRYTATCYGTLVATTCGSHDLPGQDGGTDTVLSLHTGCPGTIANELACDDDTPLCGTFDQSVRRDSFVTTPVVPGQQVLIRVATFGLSPTGPFVLHTSCEAGFAYCLGDGVGVPCPCNNSAPLGEQTGCLNSFGLGGRLAMSGAPRLSADTVQLSGSQMGSTGSCLYFQGTTSAGAGNGAAFGDGLRCASGTVVRLGTKANAAGASHYPATGDPPVSVRGGIVAAGTRTYQLWYRNAAAFCTSATFNLTNGLQISWAP